jgi:uncharacterized protein (TIGR00369 family)
VTETRSFDHCFVCGSRNESGLQLKIVVSDGEARAELQPDARWEGYPGMVHGGVITALLDDLMCHAIFEEGQEQVPVTASIEVRFRNPARIGSRLYCTARAIDRGRLVEAEGEIRDREGRLIATAKSKLLRMSQSQMDGFMGC